jgi:hypothetical protein
MHFFPGFCLSLFYPYDGLEAGKYCRKAPWKKRQNKLLGNFYTFCGKFEAIRIAASKIFAQ